MVCEDTKRKMVAAAVPVVSSAVALGLTAADKGTMKWFETLKVGKYSTKSVPVLMAGDVLSLAPLAYGSYLCYKHGGGFEYSDTTAALGVYGATMLTTTGCALAFKKRKLDCNFYAHSCLLAGAVATVVGFHYIHPKAGHMAMPFAAWSAFLAYWAYDLWQNNKPIVDF